MKKEEFLVLLNKHLSGETNIEENKLLLNYFESFQSNTEWHEMLGPKEELENKMRNRIQNALESEEVKVVPIYKSFYTKAVFKYVAAASVIVFITISLLFTTNIFQKQQNNQVVVNKKIEIGSDKATLTLEDGSVVALEKGKGYSTGNASSNGEKLIYNSENQNAIANNLLTIPRGGQFFVQLADSTKVWLNSESQLRYPVAFVDGKTRQVELLYGEAYFEVSPSTKHKGSKFKVKAQMQNVEVIGTEFNIKAYRDETSIYTTLVQGKVAVDNAGTKEILAPGEQSKVNINNPKIAVYEVDVYNEVSWRKGLFVFKGMPLKDIARVLSRWYDVDIVFADPTLGNVKFNGVLNKNQKIEDILTTIRNINFINAYEIKNHKIIIK